VAEPCIAIDDQGEPMMLSYVTPRCGLSLALCGTLTLVLLGGGCSKTPQAHNAKAAAGPTVGPCGGVKAADAAAILHIPASDVDGPHTSKVFSCLYRSRKDAFTTLSFNVHTADTPAAAAQQLASEKDGFTYLSKIQPLDNLGDEAWRAPDPRVRRLLVRKGRVWLDVVTPGDEAAQRKVAQIVLEHVQ
jgi:hypothetical protein